MKNRSSEASEAFCASKMLKRVKLLAHASNAISVAQRDAMSYLLDALRWTWKTKTSTLRKSTQGRT